MKEVWEVYEETANNLGMAPWISATFADVHFALVGLAISGAVSDVEVFDNLVAHPLTGEPDYKVAGSYICWFCERRHLYMTLLAVGLEEYVVYDENHNGSEDDVYWRSTSYKEITAHVLSLILY